MAYGYQPMYQQPYGGYQTMYQPQQTQQQTVQGQLMKYVTSRAEAEVSQIPLDGSTAYFLDTGNGKIYGKALRPDGTAPLVVYSREAEQEQQPVQYVTQEQFDALSGALAKLKKEVGRMMRQEEDDE